MKATPADNFKNFIKSISLKAWIRIIICVVCLLAFGILSLIKAHKVNSLLDENTETRWTDEGKGSAAVSLFFEQGQKKDTDAINTLRYKVTNELKDKLDITKYEFSDDDPLSGPYTYCYSAPGTVTIQTIGETSHTASNINAYGVGGDFFKFHPVALKVGRYFDDTDEEKDSLVIDANTAFNLFGSYDVEGMEVLINGIPHFIRGVYDPDTSKISKYAGSDAGYVFMSYDSLKSNGTAGEISCVEFVSVEAYSGHFYNFMKDSTKTGLSKDNTEIIENTDRFSMKSLYSNVLTNFSSRSMKKNDMVYPYWENISRVYENQFAVFMVIQIILLAIPGFILICFIFYRISKLGEEGSVVLKKLNEKIYDLEVKHKRGKGKWKDF